MVLKYSYILFQFGVNEDVWVPEIIIKLKIRYCKTKNVAFIVQRRENNVT